MTPFSALNKKSRPLATLTLAPMSWNMCKANESWKLFPCHCALYYELSILNNIGYTCVHTKHDFEVLCAYAKTSCTRPSSSSTQDLGMRLPQEHAPRANKY